ncbi:hypothetical protein F4821DRAFT_274849 [Hypoxylon rubiginosum]|uniref:Uncharacterized protein n=1 Tax=Hypoxylon rubiginosum TaxID=110542 RepID=A0ACC0CMB9_9PEZI|nr:hypothetical protein F4821DRAFT_274849 [Hypoxylon rubiginosum]
MTGRATESVEDIFKSLKKDPAGHGYEALLPSGMVVSYDQNGKIIDQKQASKDAVAEYLKVESKKPDLPAVTRPASRREIEESIGLVPRQVNCDAYPCDDDDDCQQVGCYGGCRNNFYGKKRCRA